MGKRDDRREENPTIIDALFWDDIAERYAKKPVPDVESYQRKLAILEARLSPEHVVLDVGCGTGSLALEIAPHVSRVHALDVSKEMIRIAREKSAARGVDNADFHVGALADLSFGEERFDVVCAFNILHLVPDREAVLRRLYEVLAPGGTFVSSTACLGDSFVPYRPLLSVMRWLGKAPRVYVVGRDRLVEELETAGFTDLEHPEVGAKPTTAFIVASKPRG